jgi:hypothetical protein
MKAEVTFNGVHLASNAKHPPRIVHGWEVVYAAIEGRMTGETVHMDGTTYFVLATIKDGKRVGWAAVNVANRRDIKVL